MKNIAASVAARLRNYAKDNGEVFDYVLNRYALERVLFRLSSSEHSDSFVLKGALLFYVWNQQLHRPTRDMDLLGFGPADCDDLKTKFRDILSINTVDDGLTFKLVDLDAAEIREDAFYGGVRIRIPAHLGNIRISLQVDVGFGDIVTPEPAMQSFTTLLPDMPVPQIRTYSVYTVLAEKLEAIVSLGMQNSRMKDYFDISFILKTESLDKTVLKTAILKTFERRGTKVPSELPSGLTDEFALEKEKMWNAFIRKNNLSHPVSLLETVVLIREAVSFSTLR